MEIQETRIAPKLRTAGLLIVLGLVVEVFTLKWNNPVSFLVFLGIGGLLMFLGILIYLLSLVSSEQAHPARESGAWRPDL